MAVTIDTTEALQLLSVMQRAETHRVSTDYDEEADVFDVSFSDPPQTPADSVEGEDGVIRHYDTKGMLIGYTYLNASIMLKPRAAQPVPALRSCG